MKDTFFDPTIRRAAWVAIVLSAFQQLCGINAIMFYSSAIFADSKTFTPTEITAIINTANFLATVGAIPLASRFGRKTLLLSMYVACGAF
jgi:hypothetical protein